MVIESDAPPPNPVADFEDFFKNFEDIPNQAKYRQKISDAYGKSEHFIKILFEDVLNFDPTLANYLKNQPERALQDAADAFKNILRIDSGGTLNPDDEYFVRISTLNNSNEVKLRSIRAKHIDKLIYVKGIIIRASAVHPQITIASFECPICGNLMQEPQLSKKLVMPKECTNPNCKHNKDFKILTQDSHFIDNQIITIQEAPEELRAGAIPQVLQAILLYDLVDTVRPGERVKIMGVLKSIPHEDGRGKMSVIFNTQLNVNNVEGLQQQDDEIDITQQDLEEIRSLSQEPEIQKKIARSISRAILEIGRAHV